MIHNIRNTPRPVPPSLLYLYSEREEPPYVQLVCLSVYLRMWLHVKLHPSTFFTFTIFTIPRLFTPDSTKGLKIIFQSLLEKFLYCSFDCGPPIFIIQILRSDKTTDRVDYRLELVGLGFIKEGRTVLQTVNIDVREN